MRMPLPLCGLLIHKKENLTMKRIRGISVMMSLAVLLIPLISSAQEMTYDAGFQVQNLDATDGANIQINYYRQDGTVEASFSDTVSAGGSNTYYPLSNVPEGFDGSVVISSDREIRAICNLIGNDRDYYASYGGVTAGATTVYAPLLMLANNGFNTWFNVQNMGSASTDVTVVYSDGAGNSCANLLPGASCTFDQTEETHTEGWVGSAMVSATQPVAVTVMEVGGAAMFGYDGFVSGSTDIVMPLINANNNGYITGIQIMNVGKLDTEATVTYTPSLTGSIRTETKTIQAGTSGTFAIDIFPAGEIFIGSARITGNSENQELVAIINQLNRSANKGGAYEGLDPSKATSTVFMPLVMDRNAGYYTGFNVVNVGTSPTTVNCSFSDTSYTVSGVLAPGEAMTNLQHGQIRNGYIGSCTCSASGDGKIMGIVNEVNNQLTGDSLLVYSAFNR
jgi:hypothetical protein